MFRRGGLQLLRASKRAPNSLALLETGSKEALTDGAALTNTLSARGCCAAFSTRPQQDGLKACKVPGCSGIHCMHGQTLQPVQQHRLMSAKSAEAPSDPEHVFQQIESHGEGFSEDNVANAYEQLAKLAEGMSEDEKMAKIHDNRSFQTLVDMAIAGSSRFHSKQLTNIVKSLSSLNFDDDMLVDRISQTLLKRLPSAPAEDVVDLATGLAEIGTSPSVVLFDALQKRAVELKDEVSPEQKKGLETAYEKLGYGHKGISEEIKH